MPSHRRTLAVAGALALTVAVYRVAGGGLEGPSADESSQCPPADFETVQDFDLDTFISKRWWAQQQMEVSYLTKEVNRCVYAEYKTRSSSIWGYDVSVHNHAEGVEEPHKVKDSGSFICAKVVDGKRGKLAVAPCFLPSLFAGPYWVLDYDESQGYALVSGGPPTKVSSDGCKTGSGINNSGLWIFTRSQTRDQALVDKVRNIAKAKGFDLSVLNDVDNSACTEPPTEFGVTA